MKGLKVGHVTNKKHGTGVSVFLMEKEAEGAYVICGSGPASHELAALELDNSGRKVHGLLFAGGSAFGLLAVKGVMTYLSERGIGFQKPDKIIPIVPAAAIYDFNYGPPLPPTEEDAYEASVQAYENNKTSGRIGAGHGAMVGKVVRHADPMSGGVGVCELTLTNGLTVIAYTVVNAIGDIRNEKNKIVAGALLADGQFANCEEYLSRGLGEKYFFAGTTLVAIFTNALFSKIELKRIAKMAVAGFGRAIAPVFTRYDGDIVFCFSCGNNLASELTVGTMAAEATRMAILNAVEHSEKIT